MHALLNRYWQTNLNRYATADLGEWVGSQDDLLVRAILRGCRAGAFGPSCNADAASAIGFSSGAYMTSRMAFSYPRQFKALAIQVCRAVGC